MATTFTRSVRDLASFPIAGLRRQLLALGKRRQDRSLREKSSSTVSPRNRPACKRVWRRHRPASREGLEHRRSEEHTSELQSLMRISYAVFCLKKKIET